MQRSTAAACIYVTAMAVRLFVAVAKDSCWPRIRGAVKVNACDSNTERIFMVEFSFAVMESMVSHPVSFHGML